MKAIPLPPDITMVHGPPKDRVYKQTCSVSVVLIFHGEVQRGDFNKKKKKKETQAIQVSKRVETKRENNLYKGKANWLFYSVLRTPLSIL